MKAQTKNKLTLIALAVLFLVPLITAVVMNSQLMHYSPESYKNNGNFIQPPIKVSDKESLKPYEGFWTVVYQHSGECEQGCQKMLDTLYRIRLTKGHRMKKIKLLVMHPEAEPLEIPEQYTSIEQQSYLNKENINEIFNQLSEQSLGDNKGLYLLAPEGFLMMSYPKDFKPEDVIKDLGLMLRARKNEG